MPEVNRKPGAYAVAYCDGSFVDETSLTVHVGSLAMRYALSCFEGVRAYRMEEGGVSYFALDEHLERLAQSLRLTGLPGFAEEPLREGLARLLVLNHVDDDCYLRLAASAVGSGDLFAEPRLSVSGTLTPMGRKPWLSQNKSVAVRISARRKPSDAMFPQSAKNISNYPGPRLALLEARGEGFDNVLLLSADGFLAEAPTANIFLVSRGRLLTPKLSDSILHGITRSKLLSLARELGIETEERRLTPHDAYQADEAFLCGTGLELAPIGRFDDKLLSCERPVTQTLTEAYFALARSRAKTRAVRVERQSQGAA